MPLKHNVILACIVSALFVAGHGGMNAATSGASGAGVLNFIPDPQYAGCGGTLLAFPESASAFLGNPASSVRMYRARVALTDGLLPEGMNYRFAALSLPTPMGVAGISAGYLGYGPIQGRNASGTLTADPEAGDIVATLNFSRALYRGGPSREIAGAAGVNVKIVNCTLAEYTARAVAFDIGGFYSFPFSHRLFAGAAARNIGGKLSFVNREDPLPSVLETGVRYGNPDIDRAAVMLEYGRDLADGRDSWNLGADYRPVYPVVLRAGWKESPGSLDTGIRGGLGFEFNDISFNYAVSGFRDFAPTHWIGVDIGWGGISDPGMAYDYHLRAHFLHARDQYLKKDFISARQELEEILSMYPDHAPSKEYLGKISEELDVLEQERMKKVGEYLRRAGVSMDRRDYMRAGKFYAGVLAVDPGNGIAANGMKKIQEAVEKQQQDRTVRKNIDQVERLWKDAVRDFRKGNLVESREKFKTILDMNPENREARAYVERIDTQLGKVTRMQLDEIFDKGMALYDKGDHLTAKKYFNAVVTADPERTDAQQFAEQCAKKLREGETRKVSELTTLQQEQAKEEVEALYSRGITYFENGSFDDALKTLSRSRELAIRNKMEKQAERAKNTMTDIRTSLAEDRFKAGFEQFNKNNLESAASEYRKALEYNPEYTSARVELGRVCETLGRQYYEQGMKQYAAGEADKARASFKKALSCDPAMGEARRALDRMGQ